jgi:hypothetical protein
MNLGPTPGRDEHDRFFDQVVSHYDAPAYVRRGRRVQEAWQNLLDRCREQRRRWLEMPALRLGQFLALAGDADRLLPLLADAEQVSVLRELEAELRPHLRVPIEPTTSHRQLRAALHDLRESLERFNRRWLEYLAKVDLGLVNKLREDYNRYYLLEKECAMRSATLARLAFCPLPPLTLGDVHARLPALPIPVSKEPRTQ